MIPNLIKVALGVSLDELGIGLVNVGSVSFEYIASLFSDKRIQRPCAIVTDEDKQIVQKGSTFYKSGAEKRGRSRKEKLRKLYRKNCWVKSFYAPHTLEVDFALINNRANKDYICNVIDLNYVDLDTIEKHKKNLETGNEASCAESVLTLARDMGKGWYATALSHYIDEKVEIPQYILEAIAFASREVFSIDIGFKMIEYAIGLFNHNKNKRLKENIEKAVTYQKKADCIKQFMEAYKENSVTLFLEESDLYWREL